MEKLFLIDAYALIFRYYYAFIARPMRNSAGINTSAIYGFTKFLQEIIRDERPQHLGVAFDPKGGNFRHQLYELYKANRSATPEDIIASVPYIKRILGAMRIPILEVAGYEADDVIGTIAKKAACNDFEVYMVTPDKDYGQLVDNCINIYKPKKSGFGVEIVRKEDIKNHYNIDNPCKVADILALWGDASDNVPGVPGVGEKSAIKLVSEIGTVEEILENTSRLKGKQKENVEQFKEQLILAKKLVTIDINVPIEYEPERLKMESPNNDELIEIYTELDFYSFIHDLKAGTSHYNNRPKQGVTNQPKQQDVDDWGTEHNLFNEVIPEIKEKNENLSLFDITEENDNTTHKNISNTNHFYSIVDNSNIDMLVGLLSMQSIFCFDTETSGLDPMTDELVGISFCVESGKAYYMPFNYTEQDKTNLQKLKPIFENDKIEKIGQNIKFDMLVLKVEGIEVKGFLWDTMIMHYLINSDERHNMDYLSEKYLGYTPIPISDLIGKGAKQLSMRHIDITKVTEYAAEDADITYQLYNVLKKELVNEQMEELYRTVEEPLISVLAAMEYAGVKIDKQKLDLYAKELDDELRAIQIEICTLTDEPNLNINSPKQLGEVLFDKLKIIDKPKTTKTKQYKTDEDYLQSLSGKHKVIDLILEYRGLKKLFSTYVSALPKLINPKTGRIHTSYNQAVTTTGRLSSTNPNLQNIPVREARGRQIRASFIAEQGCQLLSADYSQVELRIMAHLSGDQAMCEAFQAGLDIHTATASKIYKVAIGDVTPDMRRKAKSANFGIIYGVSVFGLSENLNIPRGEAKELIDGYFESYPKIKEYMDLSIERARKCGYSETIYGRKRYLADILSANRNTAGYAERNAINAPIQGSAADIMKIAMSNIYKAINNDNLKSRLIMQVHDEVIIEIADGENDKIKEIVIREMEGAAKLKVPLTAECGIANNWLEAH